MRWTITAGMVLEHGVLSDSLGDAEILTCVKDLLHEVRFPASSAGPTEITLPFAFGRPAPGPGCQERQGAVHTRRSPCWASRRGPPCLTAVRRRSEPSGSCSSSVAPASGPG
jgi:hypothetical protein